MPTQYDREGRPIACQLCGHELDGPGRMAVRGLTAYFRCCPVCVPNEDKEKVAYSATLNRLVDEAEAGPSAFARKYGVREW